MVWRPRHLRFATKPCRVEVNLRAIPLLPPSGWRLVGSKRFPLVGTVPKDYLVYGEPENPGSVGYISKKGRTKHGARECVTEEMISKIESVLPLRMARSKLVRLSKSDVRFLSLNFVRRGEFELLHGTELFARYLDSDEEEMVSVFGLEDKHEEHAFYTVNHIMTVLRSLYPDSFTSLSDAFFRMLAFDAFIGAPDRHAMNWGVVAPLGQNTEGVRYAPIYDTARGLFREMSDTDLQGKIYRQGRKNFLRRYAERSFPIIGTGEEEHGNHFVLVRWISTNYPDESLSPISDILHSINMKRIERMLQMRFRRIVTQVRIGAIADLLTYRLARLREEVKV